MVSGVSGARRVSEPPMSSSASSVPNAMLTGGSSASSNRLNTWCFDDSAICLQSALGISKLETLPSDQASSCVAWSSGNKTKKQGLHREDTSQAEINWFWRRTQGGRWSIRCSGLVGGLRDHYRQDLRVWRTTTWFRQDRGNQRSPHVSVFRIFRTFPYTERVHFNIMCFEVRGHCANHIWPPFRFLILP